MSDKEDDAEIQTATGADRYAWELEQSKSDAAAPPYNPNRFDFLIDLAAAVDNFRIFPRIFISVYIYLLYETVMWFMGLEAPSVEQAGLISVITGIGAAWFGLYVNSNSNRRS
jgi:hypothetical protein